MVRRILINSTPTHIRIAITEDGKLTELFTEEPDSEHHVGNIYLGRVTKIVQGMNAAFVNVGLEQDGFLHFSDVDETMEETATDEDDDDAEEDRRRAQPLTTAQADSTDVALRRAKAQRKEGKRLPTFSTKRSGTIQIDLQAKQQVIVQVTREAYAQKGVRVTTKVGLPGRNVVLLPFDSSVGVSRKVYSVKERKRLRSIARSILPPNAGCIIRTAAAGLDEADIRADFEALVEQWREIEAEVGKSKEPRLLLKEQGITHSVIRDLFKSDMSQVLVDDRKLYREIKNYVLRTAPTLASKIELYAENRPLFDAYGIEHEVHLTHQRRVPLPSGGSIVIDHTEAMVVVDVNSGRAANTQSQEGNAVRTNFEAAREVAKQLRLRDIGGIIMVDFIDMQDEANRRRLINEMKNEVARDRAKTVIYPITQLGVMQITRQRIRQALAERSSDDCPMCFGSGRVQSPATVVSGIDRWLRSYRASTWSIRVQVRVHPFVLFWIRSHAAETTRKWWRQYFLFVKLVEDDTLTGDEFTCHTASGSRDITREYM
jgi:ribonuclease G